MSLIFLVLWLIGTATTALGGQAPWLAGDFHHHTFLTDGEHTQAEVAARAFRLYGLDWLVNSEHGGKFHRNALGRPLPQPLWRWVTIRELSFPLIQALRKQYPQKFLLQGLEWNVPDHDHAGVGIIKDEPHAISDFEYLFDCLDLDHSREQEGLRKRNLTHADAVAAVRWLRDHYPEASYVIINHPSRKLKFSAAALRDLNNAAAPVLCFGLEGIPGHQKAQHRGGYNKDVGGASDKARTYGGADYMVAKVGGLWDALLAEGRRVWIFANSDFHSTKDDFWPGEFAKTYTQVTDRSCQGLVQAWRLGCSFVVTGDLLRALDFQAISQGRRATMGQTLKVPRGAAVTLVIRLQPGRGPQNRETAVHHVDLIAGHLKAPATPGTPAYEQDHDPTTRVLARFFPHHWRPEGEWQVMQYNLTQVTQSMYFRLRGTNLGLGVPDETDDDGNPLRDDLRGPHDAQKAWQDLWFYSNPIFIQVEPS